MFSYVFSLFFGLICFARIWDLSLERDEEEEADFKAKMKEQVNAPNDLPPQLLFVHQVRLILLATILCIELVVKKIEIEFSSCFPSSKVLPFSIDIVIMIIFPGHVSRYFQIWVVIGLFSNTGCHWVKY